MVKGWGGLVGGSRFKSNGDKKKKKGKKGEKKERKKEKKLPIKKIVNKY